MYLCPGNSPLLGWGYEMFCQITLRSKNQEFPVRHELKVSRLGVKHLNIKASHEPSALSTEIISEQTL